MGRASGGLENAERLIECIRQYAGVLFVAYERLSKRSPIKYVNAADVPFYFDIKTTTSTLNDEHDSVPECFCYVASYEQQHTEMVDLAL